MLIPDGIYSSCCAMSDFRQRSLLRDGSIVTRLLCWHKINQLLTKILILYWNTLNIQTIVDGFRKGDEDISDEALSHISLLLFKHVLPNGTYFIEDFEGGFGRKPTV